MLHQDITQRIIGAAMELHTHLGTGFQEVIYQRGLAFEMRCAHLAFEREKEMPILYKSEQLGTRRVDFLVEGLVIVEIKAITALEDIHLTQAKN